MKVILRKKDSVTSIVLFIYNLYKEHTGKNWIELEKLIQLMLYFGKNESTTRMGLSRMVKAGILTNEKYGEKTIYELTGYGSENLDLWNIGISRFWKRYKKRHEGWNKKWYSLVFFNFNRTSKENQFIQDELGELGMREINKNLWLSPYNISEEITELLSRNDLNYIEIKGFLDSNLSQQELLNNIFEIEFIRKRYIDFLSLVREIQEKMKRINNSNGACLPLLFELGWNFYDIAVSDPVLPLEIIEIWEGDEAAGKMKETRDYLYKKITGYFDMIS